MGLEEEIEKGWEELEGLHKDGVLDEHLESLREIECEGNVEEKAERFSSIEDEISRFDYYSNPGEDHSKAYQHLQEVRKELDQRRELLEECIDSRIGEAEEEYIILELEPENLSELSSTAEKAKDLKRSSELLGYNQGTDRSGNLASKIEFFRKNLLESRTEERFRTAELRAKYDGEYNEIKEEFDELDTHNRKSLKDLQRLASESQRLVEKYKSINDEDGINQSAKLHEDIEEEAERVAPIYESWKAKRITLAVLLLAAGIGFLKGDYIKNYVGKAIGIGERMTQTAIERTRQLNAGPEREESLPHAVVTALDSLPAEYALHFNLGAQEGNIYDVSERRSMLRFPFTAGVRSTPEGAYTIKTLEAGQENGSPSLQLETTNSDFGIAGTYSRKHLEAIKERRPSTDGNIVVSDRNMRDIYERLEEGTGDYIVVVER